VETIRVIHERELDLGPLTPGMRRQGARIADGASVLHVQTDPGAMSGWHHHSECTTYGIVLSGALRFEYGPGGRESVDLGPGDAFVVPPGLVHREGNPAGVLQSLVGFRLGPEPTVVNVDGPDAG